MTKTKTDTDQEKLDQLAEEFAARCRRGETPAVNDYVGRYPSLAGQLREVLPPIALIERLKWERNGPQPITLGSQLPERIGDYRIVREVGRGGMGIVYEAEQESLGRRVALKILPRQSLLDPKRLGRFRREAQAAARLHHTNIVPVFGLCEQDGLLFYVMQFIEGQGLDEVLADLRRDPATKPTDPNNLPTLCFSDPLPGAPAVKVGLKSSGKATSVEPDSVETSPPVVPARLGIAGGPASNYNYWQQVAGVGMQVAEALQYAHDQGTLHRDIKPANLLLDRQGIVWVTDFGLAKLSESDDLTSTGDVVGTLQYMAPESVHGQADGRSDVYSLGLTLYELLTLQTPYQESSPARLLKLIGEHEPPAPRRRNPAIPRDLETIVLKAIAREPNHRYASARDLAEDLRCFLDDRPIQARRVAAWERGWRWCRRNRGSAALAATALAFLVLAAVVGWWGYVSTGRALDRESQRRLEAEAATQRADANVELSLEALQNIFATLAQHKEPAPREPLPAISINALAANAGGDEKRPKRNEHDGPGGPGEPPPPPPSKEEFDAALLQTVLKFYDRFAEQNPTDPKLQVVAAGAFSQVAELHRRLEEFDAAATDYGRAVQVFARLEQDFPNEARYAAAKADVEMRWAALPGSAASLESQRARAKQAGQIAAELAKRFPDQPDYRALAAKAQWTLGLVARQAGQQDAAESSMREAIKQQRQLIDEPEQGRAYLAGLIAMQHELAGFLVSIDRLQDARSLVESSLALLEDGRPERNTRRMLGPQYNQYADVLERLGKTDEAATMRERAAQLRHDGPPDGPPGLRGEGSPHDGRPGGGGGRHDDGPPGFGPRGFGPPPGMGPPPFEGRDGRGPPRAGGPRGNGPREPGAHPPPRRGADPAGPPSPGDPPDPPF